MARYTPEGAAQAQKLFKERDRLRAQPVTTAREAAVRKVETSILRLTGAPTVDAARVGISAFLRATQKVKEQAKSRSTKRKKKALQADSVGKQNKKRADPTLSRMSSLPRIKVVRGGLPESGRR